MIARLLLAISLIAGPVTIVAPAAAASFDCARAGTTIEKAICGNAALSHTDETMAVAYATAVGGLSDAATAVMRRGQRNWLSYLNAVCADDMLPDYDTLEATRIDCITTQYDQRIRQLEASRMIGGLRFFVEDRYLTLPDTTGDSWAKIATKELSIARLDGDDALAKAFNDYVASEAAYADAFFDPDAPGNDDINNASETMDNSATFKVDDVTDTRISLEVNDYWYGHGAAHGNYAITYLHFLRDKNRPMVAEDLFAGEGWQDKLAQMAFDLIAPQIGDMGLFVDGPDEIVEAVSSPDRWNFEERGLLIRFQPYEVTAYAAGAVSVIVPWTQLDAMLAEDGYQYTY